MEFCSVTFHAYRAKAASVNKRQYIFTKWECQTTNSIRHIGAQIFKSKTPGIRYKTKYTFGLIHIDGSTQTKSNVNPLYLSCLLNERKGNVRAFYCHILDFTPTQIIHTDNDRTKPKN